MTLSLIVAMTQNRIIGKDNKMPWHLPADLAWFRQNTLGKPVIMGRKTFESIGRALPKRPNIVLSRQNISHQEGVENLQWQPNFESAVSNLQDFSEIMLIGGGQLFEQYLPQADRLYLTIIQTELEGDTFFPEINWDDWQIVEEQSYKKDEKNAYDCRFLILERK